LIKADEKFALDLIDVWNAKTPPAKTAK